MVSNCSKCQIVLGVKLSAVSNGPRIVFETLVCDPGSWSYQLSTILWCWCGFWHWSWFKCWSSRSCWLCLSAHCTTGYRPIEASLSELWSLPFILSATKYFRWKYQPCLRGIAPHFNTFFFARKPNPRGRLNLLCIGDVGFIDTWPKQVAKSRAWGDFPFRLVTCLCSSLRMKQRWLVNTTKKILAIQSELAICWSSWKCPSHELTKVECILPAYILLLEFRECQNSK